MIEEAENEQGECHVGFIEGGHPARWGEDGEDGEREGGGVATMSGLWRARGGGWRWKTERACCEGAITHRHAIRDWLDEVRATLVGAM